MRKGFTLIEATITLGVLAILMVIAVPLQKGHQENLNALQVQEDIAILQDIVDIAGSEVIEGDTLNTTHELLENIRINNDISDYAVKQYIVIERGK